MMRREILILYTVTDVARHRIITVQFCLRNTSRHAIQTLENDTTTDIQISHSTQHAEFSVQRTPKGAADASVSVIFSLRACVYTVDIGQLWKASVNIGPELVTK